MSLFRPDVDRIAGYTPGEQPQEGGWIKLNTNENPYPPSPRVVAAIEEAARGRLNVYPDPLATRFRQAVGELCGLDPDWVLPANGSDENLTILLRTFVEPGELVCSPYPSYILYETLAALQGARHRRLPLNADWSWNRAHCRPAVDAAKLVLVPNPNSPSGHLFDEEALREFVPPRGVLVLDEAYGDFREDRAAGVSPAVLPAGLRHMLDGKRTVLTRSLSKSYSLAGLRIGFAVAHPDLIAGMRKVKDSYNVGTLSLAAAVAAIEDQPWMQANAARIRHTRSRLTAALRKRGFDVVDSQANFLWCTRPEGGHEAIYRALKERRILVRYMRFPEAQGEGTPAMDGLRITVGADEEIDAFLAGMEDVLRSP